MRHLSSSLTECLGLLYPSAAGSSLQCADCGRVFHLRGDVLITVKPDRRHAERQPVLGLGGWVNQITSKAVAAIR